MRRKHAATDSSGVFPHFQQSTYRQCDPNAAKAVRNGLRRYSLVDYWLSLPRQGKNIPISRHDRFLPPEPVASETGVIKRGSC